MLRKRDCFNHVPKVMENELRVCVTIQTARRLFTKPNKQAKLLVSRKTDNSD